MTTTLTQGKPLSRERAEALASALSGRHSRFGKGSIVVRVEDRGFESNPMTLFVFEHRRGGEGNVAARHALNLEVTDEARAVEHYEGFCEIRGLGLNPGDTVWIPSTNSACQPGTVIHPRTGLRKVRVASVGVRRVTVKGQYTHDGMRKGTPNNPVGRHFTRKVPKGKIIVR